MSRLSLHLLGSPEIHLDDQPVALKERKALALLAYLAIAAKPHQREALATLFWPEYDQKRGRSHLRRILWVLKQTLGKGWLISDGDDIRLNQSADIWMDATELKAAEAHNRAPSSAHSLEQLEQIVARYRGDFLAGFTLPDCPAFDEWHFFEAETMRQIVLTALDALVEHYTQAKTYEAAIGHARRRLTFDPLHEPAHQTLMRLYALSGRQAAALRQFEECQRILQDELGVEPDAQTQALASDIRARRVLPSDSATMARPFETVSPTETQRSQSFAAKPSQNVLPPRATFVGRAQQLVELENALAETVSGRGQLRIITGEAGAGKTALITAFLHQAQDTQPDLIITIGASDAQTGQVNPFLPFREALLKLITTGNREWQSVISVALLEQGPDLVLTFVPAAEHPDLSAAAQAAGWRGEVPTPKQASLGHQPVDQSKLIEQVESVLRALTRQRPLILVLEDLHWVDAASLGLLFRLGQQIADMRLLILGSYRAEQAHLPGAQSENALDKMLRELQRNLGNITIDLEAARMTEGRALVDALLDTEPNQLNENFRQALYQHTGGHPLFVVELLADLKERAALVRDPSGAWIIGGKLDWRNLPGRVEGAIAGRIGHLSAEQRWLLSIASVSGEQFLAEVVAHVAGLETRQLVQTFSRDLQALHQLIEAEGVERLDGQRLTRYHFRHNLIHVYLYEQLDEVVRAYLHEDVARALEVLYGEQVNQIAVQLAHHYQTAGLIQKTVDYLILAGEQAMRLSALDEATRQFNQALTLLPELPEGNERDQQEFAIQSNLGKILRIIEGYSSDKADLAYTRALALARQLQDSQKIVQALHTLIHFTRANAEFDRAQTYGEACLRLAEEIQDPQLLMRANQSMQQIAVGLGQHGDAVAYNEQVNSLYRINQPTLTFDDIYNLVGSLGGAVLSLIPAGYPERAIRQGQEALTLAQKHKHIMATMAALGPLAGGHIYLRDWPGGLHWGEALRAFSETHNLPLGVSFGQRHKAVARAMLGEVDEGLELWREVEKKLPDLIIIETLAELGEAYAQVGRVDKGLLMVNEALALLERNKDRQREALIHRIKGDVLLMQTLPPDPWAVAQQEAEACFRRAIAVAQEQEAKLWEARALASLCRLLHSQGQDEGCRQQLADLYAWFTEGFETEDLRVVRAMLEEMG